MADSIFIIQADEKLVEMNQQDYDSEALLQRLLADYPQLLSGSQIDSASPRRWLLIKREMAIPGEEDGGDRWSVDHLFLDQDAIPTLVEVKRSCDTRIRREVVGHVLDYAANAVVYWPVEQLQAEFEKNRNDPDGALAEFLGQDSDPNEFWQRAKTNLQAGKIRMLFVADMIPPELQRIVEFLNAQMDPAEVLAVEVKQYSGHGMKTLVPRVFGQTSEATRRKGGGALSDADRLRLEYWTTLRDVLVQRMSIVKPTKPRAQPWMSFALGRAGFSLGAVISTQRRWIQVETYLDIENALACFRCLEKEKDAIQQEIGCALDWQELPGKKAKRIALRRYDTDPTDRENWAVQHQWLAEKLGAFYKAFSPRIKALDLEEEEELGEEQLALAPAPPSP